MSQPVSIKGYNERQAEDQSQAQSESQNGDSDLIDLGLLEETIDYIRPAVQMDGGDIVLDSVDGGTVNLQLVGACGGCPMATMTLKAGIERILQSRVPGVEEVIAE